MCGIRLNACVFLTHVMFQINQINQYQYFGQKYCHVCIFKKFLNNSIQFSFLFLFEFLSSVKPIFPHIRYKHGNIFNMKYTTQIPN